MYAATYYNYYGKYIGKINSCEYASVEKKGMGKDNIYNFKQCKNNIKYIGETLNRKNINFKPYLYKLEKICKIKKAAMLKIKDFTLYCRFYRYKEKIFILNNKYQLIKEIK